jgi:HK97 family phage prohead protease
VKDHQVRDVVAGALAAQREVRLLPATAFRLERAAAGDGLTLKGYASVFDVEYEMYGGPPWGWDESVDPGAFDKTLRERPDVQLLVNHTGLPLARTKSGTLRLATDNVGLETSADLESRSAVVQELALAMDRRDIDEMSFAFRVVRQEWDEEYVKRRLVEVNIHRGDVSVVNYGANPATSATLRALSLAGLADLEPAEILAEVRAAGVTDMATLAAVRDVLARAVAAAPPAEPDAPAAGMSLDEARQLSAALSAA